MIRRPVRSSNVASVGWEADTEDFATGTLEVEFRDGSLYTYEGVPEAEYERLIGAGSVGRYLNAHIIPNYDRDRS